MKSLSRAVQLLKSVGLDHASQSAAAALACHLEGKLIGASDSAVVDMLRGAVGALKAAFTLKSIAAVDPVAVVALAVKSMGDVEAKQIQQSLIGAPVEPAPAVEAEAPVEPVVEEKATGKGARAK